MAADDDDSARCSPGSVAQMLPAGVGVDLDAGDLGELAPQPLARRLQRVGPGDALRAVLVAGQLRRSSRRPADRERRVDVAVTRRPPPAGAAPSERGTNSPGAGLGASTSPST